MPSGVILGKVLGASADPQIAANTAAISALQAVDPTKADKLYTLNAQTGTTYSLGNTDNGKLTTLNNAAAIALTVPNTLTVGSIFPLAVLGAGQVTVAGSGGMVVQPPPGFTLKSRGQYSRMTVEILSSTLAVLSGDLAFV